MAPNYGLFYGDDFVLLTAACFSISMTAMVWRLYHLGYGMDLDLTPVENNYPIGRISLALFSMFPMCYSMIRTSILLTYLKLFPSQTNRWLCWALCGLQVVYWNKTIEGWECNKPRNQDFAILTLNSCFDLIVYIWPAHYLYKLNLPFKSRLELTIAFSIGVVNLGLSFARLSLLIAMYSTEEWMRYGPPGVLIIIVESHIGIICASLPYLRFVFELVSTNYLSKSTYGVTKDPTKAKQSDANHRKHPFVELEGRSGGGIQRKTDIEISTFREEPSDEDLPATIYGGRNRAMEEQMRRDERAWSGEEVLLEERYSIGQSGRRNVTTFGKRRRARQPRMRQTEFRRARSSSEPMITGGQQSNAKLSKPPKVEVLHERPRNRLQKRTPAVPPMLTPYPSHLGFPAPTTALYVLEYEPYPYNTLPSEFLGAYSSIDSVTAGAIEHGAYTFSREGLLDGSEYLNATGRVKIQSQLVQQSGTEAPVSIRSHSLDERPTKQDGPTGHYASSSAQHDEPEDHDEAEGDRVPSHPPRPNGGALPGSLCETESGVGRMSEEQG
ncbi:hypothetical protein E8E12_002786 [Didymella heteroderae]|uniref:Rhodopsin domain-containing protein n=1 Tax=Didymella heteroderae TaxID=1769908 RepID=A0A9P4WJK0_9PLEO|nr:hypothetical protein E8E12_002786 [Didymella heteroderae]